ncbi:MAG: ornithine carbamoyltransferase [Vicinamibacterales bacterium]
MDIAPPPAIPKDFLSVADLSSGELVRLLEQAERFKADRLARRIMSPQPLAGMHVAMLFEKPSLRTRSTFEIAVRELGGDTLNLSPEFADGKREPLKDVARNLERWVHALVIRTYGQEKAATIAAAAPRLHVVNALTDEEHPCQALADMMTLRERWGSMRGRRLAFVGDGNNVATSLAQAALMLGVTVHVASPAGYALPDRAVPRIGGLARDGAELRLFSDPRQAVAGVHAVYTDVWTSMGQEVEAAERAHAFEGFQVNASLMQEAAKDALFMHCLPAHRGEEVTADVFESPASVVFDQAENRLHTQKALLALLLSS